MVKLHFYEDLCKKPDEFFGKKYFFGTSSIYLLASKGGFSVSSKSIFTNKVLSGSCKLSYSSPNFSISHKHSTTQSSTYNLTLSPQSFLKTFKILCDCKILRQPDHIIDSSVGLEYTYDSKLTTKLSYNFQKSEITTNITGLIHEIQGGGALKFSKDLKSFTELSATVSWHPKLTNLILRYESSALSLGTLLFYMTQKINPSLTLCSKISSNLKSSSNSIMVGYTYRTEDGNTLRGKICDQGDVGLAFSRKLTEEITGTVSAGFNIQDLISHSAHTQKLGFRLGYSTN